MLTIRAAQLEVFAELAEARFVEQRIDHVGQFWPDVLAEQGREGVGGVVRAGMRRANAYGLSTAYDVARFIDLLFMPGASFDSEPAHPWAQAALFATALTPAEKMDVLCEKALSAAAR